MKLTLIASEFPPAIGGMESLAAGLASALAKTTEVSVLTRAAYAGHSYNYDFPVYPCLTLCIQDDADVIKDHKADAYLSLNAGYAPLAEHVDAPFFSYCHGNDFLSVWINSMTRAEDFLVDRLASTPFFWRYRFTVRRRLLQSRIQRGLTRNASVFVNSSHTMTRLKETCPRIATPMLVVPPGLSLSYFVDEPIRENQQSGGPLRLLTISRLTTITRRKNVDGVLRALAHLRDELDFFYTVVGDGDMRGELECLSAELGIRDRVAFLGSVSEEDKLSILDETDLFVMCSKATTTDSEGFGIVYIEAAARGVPSLASRNGGAVDAIAENVTGRFVEHGEFNEIAEEIRWFSRNLHGFFSEKIIAFARRFEWSNIAKTLLSIVKQYI